MNSAGGIDEDIDGTFFYSMTGFAALCLCVLALWGHAFSGSSSNPEAGRMRPTESSRSQRKARRLPPMTVDDLCPICLTAVVLPTAGSSVATVGSTTAHATEQCVHCGHWLHGHCLTLARLYAYAGRGQATCPLCRAADPLYRAGGVIWRAKESGPV